MALSIGGEARRHEPSSWHRVENVRFRLLLAVCAAVATAVAAGCGTSSRKAETTTRVTVPSYGVFPAATITGPAAEEGDSVACRRDATSFTRDAADFLAHSGPRAAYPADLAFVELRSVLADFLARRCDPELLGRDLERALTAKQRAALVAGLPRAIAATVREALSAPRRR
jgi:hypothetical protein